MSDNKLLLPLAGGFIISGIYLLYKTSNDFYKYISQSDSKNESDDLSSKKSINYYEKYLKKINECNINYVNLTLKTSLEIEELLSIISKSIEEELFEIESENRQKRIKSLNYNDDFEYAKNIEKLYEKRNKICTVVKDTVIDQYKSKVKSRLIENSDKIEINIYSLIKTANMKNVEKIMKKIYVPLFTNVENRIEKNHFIMSKEDCEDALNYYKDISIKLISEYKMSKINDGKNVGNNDLNFKGINDDLLIIKTKMEDLLFIKYGVTFSQLEFLIDLYKLNKKESIKEILSVVKY